MASDSANNLVVLDANILIAAIRPDIGRKTVEEGAVSARLLAAIDQSQVHGFAPAPVLSEVVHVLGRNGIPAPARAALVTRWLSPPDRLTFVSVDANLAVEAGEYR